MQKDGTSSNAGEEAEISNAVQNEKISEKGKDKISNWLVLTAIMFNSVVGSGVLILFGIVLNDITVTLNVSNAAASLAIAILLAAGYLSGAIAVIFINLYTVRNTVICASALLFAGLLVSHNASSIFTLYVTYGLLGGTGYCFIRLSSVVRISQHFDNYHSLAFGVFGLGFSVGRIVLTPVLQIIQTTYGFRAVFLLSAAFSLNMCGTALLLDSKSKKNPENVTDQKNNTSSSVAKPTKTSFVKSILKANSKSSIDWSLCQNSSYLILVTGQGFYQLCFIYTLAFTLPFALDKGFEPMTAALIVTYKSLFEVVGRLGIPWLLIKANINNVPSHIILNIVCGLLVLAQTAVDTYLPFLLLTVVVGLLHSAIGTESLNLFLTLFGQKKFPSAMGFQAVVTGFLLLFGGPVFGLIRDLTGNFSSIFIVLSSMQFLYALLWVRHYVIDKTKRKPPPEQALQVLNNNSEQDV